MATKAALSTHKCPDCEQQHPCNLWGVEQGTKHLIYCPTTQNNYEIITGRMGRQTEARLIERKEVRQ